MTITKYFHHSGRIDELSARYHSFSRLKNASVNGTHLKWKNESTGAFEYHAQVAFFGKSGYGKSSTVNSFFGKSILKTSDVEACTRRCDTLDFELSPGCYLSLADFPGIGENEYRDKEYLKMYAEFLSASMIVVYVLRADQRDWAIDEFAYKTVFSNVAEKKKVIFALNCCDKIEPVSRSKFTTPNMDQQRNIDAKVNLVRKIFAPENLVVPYSADAGWNMNKLADEIVRVVSFNSSVRLTNE